MQHDPSREDQSSMIKLLTNIKESYGKGPVKITKEKKLRNFIELMNNMLTNKTIYICEPMHA